MSAGDDLESVAGYLAAMINGHARMRRYIRANWSTADGLKIHLVGKYGKLILENPLQFNHLDREEVIRIQATFGGDSEWDEPIIDGSFDAPLGDKQSPTNIVKGVYRSAVNDWAETPINRKAGAHIKQTRTRNVEDMNLSAVDNFHQAARLEKIRLGKLRLCNWFCEFENSTIGCLLDVGDVVAVRHYTVKGRGRYSVITIEDVATERHFLSKIVGRQYRSEIFDDTIDEAAAQMLLPLQAGTATNTDPGVINPPTGSGEGDSGLGGDRRPDGFRGAQALLEL